MTKFTLSHSYLVLLYRRGKNMNSIFDFFLSSRKKNSIVLITSKERRWTNFIIISIVVFILIKFFIFARCLGSSHFQLISVHISARATTIKHTVHTAKHMIKTITMWWRTQAFYDKKTDTRLVIMKITVFKVTADLHHEHLQFLISPALISRWQVKLFLPREPFVK